MLVLEPAEVPAVVAERIKDFEGSGGQTSGADDPQIGRRDPAIERLRRATRSLTQRAISPARETCGLIHALVGMVLNSGWRIPRLVARISGLRRLIATLGSAIRRLGSLIAMLGRPHRQREAIISGWVAWF